MDIGSFRNQKTIAINF